MVAISNQQLKSKDDNHCFYIVISGGSKPTVLFSLITPPNIEFDVENGEFLGDYKEVFIGHLNFPDRLSMGAFCAALLTTAYKTEGLRLVFKKEV